ncbi:MAG: nitroreductase family protein [Erysipelotrichaceae bacterium]
MSAIFKRVSNRAYLDQAVEEEKIELLMRAAMAAPSAHNQQAWEFYVVENSEKIQQLSKAHQYAKPAQSAPVVIVPCYYSTSKAPAFREIDISASVENILLQATEMNLGSLWMGIAPFADKIEIVRKILAIPADLVPFCLIAIGYPSDNREQKDRYQVEKVHRIK